jgi:protein ImuA
MSQGGVSERILFLRRSLAAIEARSGAQKAPAAAPRPAEAPSRDPFERLLDRLGAGGLGEIVPARPRDAACAGSFAFALALRCALSQSRALIWIAQDMVASEIGLPYGREWANAGLDLARSVLVRSRRPDETLWAMEEALKTPAAIVVAESWMAPGAYGLAGSRRLLLATRAGGGMGLLLLPRAAGASLSAAQPVAVSRRLPTPGPLAWRLRIAKARAGFLGEAADCDPSVWRDISFDPEKAVFRHAFPQRLSAPPFDRPDPARLRESA